jgi:hypothetical protein
VKGDTAISLGELEAFACIVNVFMKLDNPEDYAEEDKASIL